MFNCLRYHAAGAGERGDHAADLRVVAAAERMEDVFTFWLATNLKEERFNEIMTVIQLKIGCTCSEPPARPHSTQYPSLGASCELRRKILLFAMEMGTVRISAFLMGVLSFDFNELGSVPLTLLLVNLASPLVEAPHFSTTALLLRWVLPRCRLAADVACWANALVALHVSPPRRLAGKTS